MKRLALAVPLILGVVLSAAPAAGTAPPAGVLLADVAHALDGRMLVITGRVLNTGASPIGQLVIDAAGFGPAGDLVASGSDGIPWQVAPGQAESFRIAIPLARHLIREYVVEVSRVPPGAPLASARRGVGVALYRDHLRTLIELRGDVLHGILSVRVVGPVLPIAGVTAEATVLVFDPLHERFRPLRVSLDLAPGRPAEIFVGSRHAILISLRVVDLRLQSTWSD